MRRTYLSWIVLTWIVGQSLPDAHADQTQLTEKYSTAFDYCSTYAQGTFLRALERKHFQTSARAHAAIPKDNPGEGTAKVIHEMIELVYKFPDKKPHELAILGYARCINRFADSFWAYDNTN